MFREYKLTGMKLEYRPYSLNISTQDVILKAITCGTVMAVNGAVVMPLALSQYRASLDAKTYNPNRNFKRYYHLTKWGAGKEINWRNCSDASGNVYGNATPDAITCFEMDTLGLANGALMGSIMVTYYAKFRGRTTD